MLLSLLQHVSMLLSVVVIYALITNRHNGYLLHTRKGQIVAQVQTGVMTGLVTIALILTPIKYSGLLLDARSILLSLTALVFGVIPALITLLIAALYRLYVGGPAVAPALVIMSSSTLVGLAWRRARKQPIEQIGLIQLYGFGLAVHLAIIAIAFLAPSQLMLAPLRAIALPLVLIFPVAELVIGGLLVRFVRQEITAQETKLSEERYRLLADNVTDIILHHDLEWRICYVSPSVRQLGYSPQALVGQVGPQFAHPDDIDGVRKRVGDVTRGLAGGSFEVRVRKADGSWVWVETNPAALRDETGRIIGILSIWRDVTARKEAEATLREVRAELARVARISALGAFSASLAHEINQPLAALVTNSDIAQRFLSADPPDLPMVEKALARSARDARRASAIVAGMRAMITRGPSIVAHFDINDAIEEVLTLTQGEQQRLQVTTETDLIKDTVVMHGDRIQIQQVMLNLIQNAIEAMRSTPEADRRLLVRSGVVANGDILVEVEDRGPGLDPNAADHMFDRLFTTKAGGTGLGLTISKSIIEAHGGRIWAAPAAPSGAVFRFQMPRGS